MRKFASFFAFFVVGCSPNDAEGAWSNLHGSALGIYRSRSSQMHLRILTTAMNGSVDGHGESGRGDRTSEYGELFALSAQQQRTRPSLKSETSNHELSQALALLTPLRECVQSLKAALRSSDEMNFHEDLVSDFARHMETTIDDLFGSYTYIQDDAIRSVLTDILKDELHELMLQSRFVKHAVVKPQGYAGDFLIIDMIYNNKGAGSTPLGLMVDKHAMSLQACVAVRNRRRLFTELFGQVLGNSRGDTVQITSMACGAAREVQDLFSAATATPDAMFHLIDLDIEALGKVQDWMDALPFGPHDRVSCYQKNLLHLAVGREELAISPQDLVYSVGLIDYFRDKAVVRLLNYAHDILKPGGKVLVGNFHKNNPTRGFMDTVLEWKLIHRDEDNMNVLFKASKFGKPCTDILLDDTGIQMIACCVK